MVKVLDRVPRRFASVSKLNGNGLVTPQRDLVLPDRVRKAIGLDDGMDPVSLGWDRQVYSALAAVTEESDRLDYASAGQDFVELSRDRFITGITLVADPYRHDVTTAVIVPVQDAVDKIISAMSLNGRVTYFNLSSTLLFLKALSAMNKNVYGSSLPHQDLATAVAADNDSLQAWHIPFGAWNDKDKYDITAGIPAELETTLRFNTTFGANNLIAVVAANGTVDTATDIYVVNWGVQGLPREYIQLAPVPDFRHHHTQTVQSTVTIPLETGRYLKRMTIVNLAVLASNNEARNDSNMTVVTFRIKRPTTTLLWERIRWEVMRSMHSPFTSVPDVDRDGTAAIMTVPLSGVLTVDWRNYSKNPYGLNLYPFQSGDVELEFELGVTTGSIHVFFEYYALPDPTIADAWDGTPYRPR